VPLFHQTGGNGIVEGVVYNGCKVPLVADGGVEIFVLPQLAGAVFVLINPEGSEEFYGMEDVLQVNRSFFCLSWETPTPKRKVQFQVIQK